MAHCQVLFTYSTTGCVPDRYPVAIVQRALLDLGYLMPITTMKTGCPDGIYGPETANVVLQFQKKYGLGTDGITGKQTLEKLDALLRSPATNRLPYMVPGLMNLTIEGWVSLLHRHGLLWIGASVRMNPNTGLHSRILEGMFGDGTLNGTAMKMIDPDGGRQYVEPFTVFPAKYESGILSVGGEYFQIRHF